MVLGSFISTDKNAIVCEIGRAFTRCGYAGDNAPRCIVRTRIQHRKTGKLVDLFSLRVDSSGEFYDHLIDFLDSLYFKQLLANPRDRNVVLVESVYAPTWLRDLLARAFFSHFEVPAVLFVPTHLAALFSIGKSTGVVLDVGYSEAHATPVYDGETLMNVAHWCSVGAQVLHERVETMLLANSQLRTAKRTAVTGEQTASVPLSSVTSKLDSEFVEDVKVRFCFCTTMERAIRHREGESETEQQETTGPAKRVPSVELSFSKGEFLLVDPRTREYACECLFETDADETSIATALLDTLIAAPIDIRRALAENIVLIGGTTVLRGFKQRLKAELLYLLEHGRKYRLENVRGVADALRNSSFRFAKLTASPNYAAWLGAAIVANPDLVQMRFVSREAYVKAGNRLTDWSDYHFRENREQTRVISGSRSLNTTLGADGSPNKSQLGADAQHKSLNESTAADQSVSKSK